MNEIEYVDYRKKKSTKPSQTKTVEEIITVKEKNVKEYKTPDDVSDEAIAVFKVLGETPLHIDDIIRVTGMKMNTVLSA